MPKPLLEVTNWFHKALDYPSMKYPQKELKMNNVTFSLTAEEEKLFLGQDNICQYIYCVNGVYRVRVRAFNVRDPNLYSFTFYLTVKLTNNEGEF